MNYYIGPWQQLSDGGETVWTPPVGVVGLVDLRPLAGCMAAPPDDLNFGFFASTEKLDSAYTLLGTALDGEMTPVSLDAWTKLTGVNSLASKQVLDVLWETLTVAADPDQLRRVQPIRPTQSGIVELHLSGHSLVRSHRFAGEADPMWPNIRAALRRDFRRQFEQDHGQGNGKGRDRDTHRRVLTDWMGKYKIKDWRQFVPDDLTKHVEGPKPKHTTIGDTFVDTDGTDLSAHTATGTGGGFGWTELLGDFDIVSNKCEFQTASGLGLARADSDLSSDDHYAQGAFTGFANISAGTLVRKDSSNTETHYHARCESNRTRLWKYVDGVGTLLDTEYLTPSSPTIVKTHADGSTITGFLDGVENTSATDATITGNVRTGIRAYQTSPSPLGTCDTFVAADIDSGNRRRRVLICGAA